jgi:hypothetical protein
MPFADHSRVVVEQVSDNTFCLQEPLIYHGHYETFTVPAGYVTDFASVPRPLVWLIPTYGKYTQAAILHDYLITDAQPARLITSVDTDGMFRRVMRELGVPFARRWLMWCGVRWGAIFNPRRREGSLRTLPKVALVSLLALPIVLPGVLGVAVSLLISASTWRT